MCLLTSVLVTTALTYKKIDQMSKDKCCVVTCKLPLGKTYWENQYQANSTGWDLGQVAPPIQLYIDQIQNKDLAILIPGCGNSYEAAYLLEQGFTNVTVIDIAPTLVYNLTEKFKNNTNITILLGDFFEHQGQYDLIIEQTFFCALPLKMRQKYVWKQHQLLSNQGLLSGVLFNRSFEVSPPFGGTLAEYAQLFQHSFAINRLEVAQNSVVKRQNAELFFEFHKNNVAVNLYFFEGITCSDCKKTVTEKLLAIDGVLNVSMNTDFSEILIVSLHEIELHTVQYLISYDENYKINKAKK
jgi:SAM-dependent methyltransferase